MQIDCRDDMVVWHTGQVWQAGVDGVQEGETLQYDPTAYDCLHQLTFEWPCLRRAPTPPHPLVRRTPRPHRALAWPGQRQRRQ